MTGYVPEHWTWHSGPVEPGAAVVVDIDGVLSDAASRQHYLEAPRRNWAAFFEACGEDPVIEEVRVMLDLLDPALQVVLLTARPERVHHLTEAWLRHYDIRWDLLLMRPWGDYEMSASSSRVRCGTSGPTASTCAWPSRTTAATWRCSAPRASPASTSTRVTTIELSRSSPVGDGRRIRQEACDSGDSQPTPGRSGLGLALFPGR